MHVANEISEPLRVPHPKEVYPLELNLQVLYPHWLSLPTLAIISDAKLLDLIVVAVRLIVVATYRLKLEELLRYLLLSIGEK